MKHLKVLFTLMIVITTLSAKAVDVSSATDKNYNLTLLSGKSLYAIDLLTVTPGFSLEAPHGTIVIREWLPRPVFRNGLPQRPGIRPFFKYTTFKITNRIQTNKWTMKYHAVELSTVPNRTLTLVDYNHGPSPEVRQYAIEVIITSTSGKVRYGGNRDRSNDAHQGSSRN